MHSCGNLFPLLENVYYEKNNKILRICVSFMEAISFLYFAEVYPTVVRCIGMAVQYSTLQISFILVYISFEQYKYENDYITYLLLIGITFLLVLYSQFLYKYLPETKERDITDEIEEKSLS
jgi:hypothetical protein